MQISKSSIVAVTAVAAICIAPAAFAADTDVQAKARQALRQKMQELEQPYETFAQGTAASTADPAAVAQARAALRSKMNQLNSESPEGSRSEADEARAARQAKKSAALAFPALEPPASPLSAEKQQRLAELLQRYRADELTPEEYHRERAKIMAGK